MADSFRWTRAKYKRASHLARLLPQIYSIHASAPPLVQRWLDLMEPIGQQRDPLTVPLRYRHPSDEIPF